MGRNRWMGGVVVKGGQRVSEAGVGMLECDRQWDICFAVIVGWKRCEGARYVATFRKGYRIPYLHRV